MGSLKEQLGLEMTFYNRSPRRGSEPVENRHGTQNGWRVGPRMGREPCRRGRFVLNLSYIITNHVVLEKMLYLSQLLVSHL